MSKFLWVQDINPLMGTGGGLEGGSQLTDRTHIIEGLKRGHNISILIPENQNIVRIESNTLVIFSNIARFMPEKLSTLPNKYVIFHHDYWYWCKYRLYLPMNEKCLVNCPQAPLWETFLKRAKLHIFLSPLHYHVNKEKFGEMIEPHILIPSPIETDKFVNLNKPDRKDTCNLNGLLKFKGRDTILDYVNKHTEESFTFAGANDRPGEVLPPNSKFVDAIPNDGLNDFFNNFEYYLELPNTPQPFNRTVMEAYLSGCKVKGNSLVGALTWPWVRNGRETIITKLKEAPGEFWKGVEAYLQ